MGFIEKLFSARSNATPVHVNDSNFRQEVLNHDGPLLLDIWGPGCAPCQRLVPVLQSLAKEYDGRVKICELNAAEAPRTASKLGVRGTPTIVVYRRRSEIGRLVGFHPKSYFVQMIETEFGDEPQVQPVTPEATSTNTAAVDADAQGLSRKAQKKREKKARQIARVAG
ncbi:MAG: thioredoxin domain-containing protein [Pseudomonadota bacterium]